MPPPRPAPPRPAGARRRPAPTLVVVDEALAGVDFGPGHPMAPGRATSALALARDLGLLDGPGTVLAPAPPPPDDAEVLTAHDPGYVAAVRCASADGVPDPARGLGTVDVPVVPGMHEAASRVLAASTAAARAVWSGRAGHAVNLAGGMHHAARGAASGFCVYNDAVAAIAALRAAGCPRVAYVDLDAHHGDGVEAAFVDDPDVLTISLHESGTTLFPGTGASGDAGGPGAEGAAVSVALAAGTGDAAWLGAVTGVVPALLRAFAPDVVVSQHGADAHGADPLTHLRVSVDAQRAAAALVHALAHEVAAGRWLALGGGGYEVTDVVPRAWAHLVGVAVHAPVAATTPVPAGWRDAAAARHGRPSRELMGGYGTDGEVPPSLAEEVARVREGALAALRARRADPRRTPAAPPSDPRRALVHPD